MTEQDNFWSSFPVEVPSRFQKFLRRDSSTDSWAQTFGYHAHGYSYAFERLIMIAIELWPQAEYLRMPVFFLARHSAELHLKNVIQELSDANGIPYDAAKEHNLMRLWNKAIAQVATAGWPVNDEWSALCGKLLQHMNDIDPDGQRLRYPEDNDGNAFPRTLIELRALAKAHANITMWCEAVGDMLHEARMPTHL